MSIASTNNRNDYLGAGSTAVYDYVFHIAAESHLLVTVRDTADPNAEETTLVLETDYTVQDVGEEAGGTITLVDAAQSWLDVDGFLEIDFHLTIRRVRPLTQTTDIRNQGEFFPEVHEDAFDARVEVDQQQQAQIDGSMRLPETVPPDEVSTVLPVPVANKVLGWNDDGTALVNLSGVTSTETGSIPIVSGDARGVVSVNDAESAFVIYTISEWLDLVIGVVPGTILARGTSVWGPLQPPDTQVLTAGNTIAADANGTIKRISAASAIATDTVDPFTTPAATNKGFVMDVVNVGTFNITIKRSVTTFKTDGGEDCVLEPGHVIRVGSTGAGGFWYQLGPMSINS